MKKVFWSIMIAMLVTVATHAIAYYGFGVSARDAVLIAFAAAFAALFATVHVAESVATYVAGSIAAFATGAEAVREEGLFILRVLFAYAVWVVGLSAYFAFMPKYPWIAIVAVATAIIAVSGICFLPECIGALRLRLAHRAEDTIKQ